MEKVIYEKDGRIARITLNRPEVMNAIDDELPCMIAEYVSRADTDSDIHVMILSGNGAAFCAGYDLDYYTENNGKTPVAQDMPWDPIQDYSFMWRNTQHFMSLWHAMKPVICKVHGYAVAGGSDIALCADITFIEETAQIGYMPARVWGTPTTAMWVYRLGPEKAKRMLFTGDKITGREAEKIGLVLKALPINQLDTEVEKMAARMATIPINQLAMQKMVINQAIAGGNMESTQRLATLFDGISRHSPEGQNFKRRVEKVGWKQAIHERDAGAYDWSYDAPVDD